jgi:hypothetical protein
MELAKSLVEIAVNESMYQAVNSLGTINVGNPAKLITIRFSLPSKLLRISTKCP